ncbi:hypothetical protein ACFS5N_04470 [Mucilaginibacter ximonensis]|uniref:Uncharacterized protein n=1 Tax=Mucilaginibacter ximonensis TaxID=538021 RepID=A0ABW5Y8M2_9SPHI
METPFYLLFSLKTPDGYDTFGEFTVGTDRELTYALFDSLKGDKQLREDYHFHIDLIETVNALPEKIRSKCCKLDQLGENMKLIAREVYRQKNLDE